MVRVIIDNMFHLKTSKKIDSCFFVFFHLIWFVEFAEQCERRNQALFEQRSAWHVQEENKPDFFSLRFVRFLFSFFFSLSRYDNLANLFAIVKTAEALEKAYARDAVNAADYRQEMFKLIAHYKSAREATKEHVPNMAQFLVDYQLGAGGAGFARLEQGFPSVEKKDNGKTIAEAVQHFISLMDALRLNMVAVDQVQPLLQDLVESIEKCSFLETSGHAKLKAWLNRVSGMAANAELDPESVRQLLFDLDTSYASFHKALKWKYFYVHGLVV